MKELPKTNLLGIDLTQGTISEVLEFIYTSLEKKNEKYFVVTPNTEIFMISRKNPDYKNVLNSAKLALPDSVGVMWAGKIMAKNLKERIPGVELLEKLSEGCAKRPITVGFFGGRGNVAEFTAECLKEKYPGLRVAFAVEDWPENNKLSCDLLFVALGSPKQEFWVSENLSKIDTRIAIGVGGSFDFISGKVRRAPKLIRDLGLEWLFRLVRQPWRIRRQLVLPQFVIWVLSEKFKSVL